MSARMRLAIAIALSSGAALGAPPEKPVQHELPAEIAPPATAGVWIVPPKLKQSTKVNLGKVERFTLPNGLLVIAVPRHSVPSVQVSLAVRGGGADDPVERAGLAQFTASMLRKGTATRSSDQIAEAIDSVGGSLDADAQNDGTFVSCHARAKELALCLDLVSDLAEHPSFPESEMGEIREQLQADVESAKDHPRALAAEHLMNLYFGDGDTRGRPTSERSLAAIDRAQLVEFHGRFFAPNNAVLAISGDVDEKALRGALAKAFGGWKRRAVPKRLPEKLPQGTAMRVRLVDKPDATQSVIDLAGAGIAHRSPDYLAVRLMNYALGGGSFSSRLMKVVRSDNGKTYGASSRYDTGRDPGPFLVNTFTRNAETAATLKLVLDEIAKMRAGGPNGDELDAAKGNLIGGYGLRLETGSDLAGALLGAELDGLPPGFVEKYPAAMAKVTLAEAKQAGAAHLQPTALVIVGRAAEVKPLLEQAGFHVDEEVAYEQAVSAADRKATAEVKGHAASGSSAEEEAGRKLLALAVAAQGGAALGKLRDVTRAGKGTLTMRGQTLPIAVTEYDLLGHAHRADLTLAGSMSMSQVVSDGKAFVKSGTEVQDVPEPIADRMARVLWLHPARLLTEAGLPGAKVHARPPVQEGAARYDVLEVVNAAGGSVRLYLDAATHLPARAEHEEGGKKERMDLSGWAAAGGVQMPAHILRASGDGEKLDLTYDKTELNKGLDPKLFAK